MFHIAKLAFVHAVEEANAWPQSEDPYWSIFLDKARRIGFFSGFVLRMLELLSGCLRRRLPWERRRSTKKQPNSWFKASKKCTVPCQSDKLLCQISRVAHHLLELSSLAGRRVAFSESTSWWGRSDLWSRRLMGFAVALVETGSVLAGQSSCSRFSFRDGPGRFKISCCWDGRNGL